MANVIQIRRQPTGYETFGQSMQDLSNNFVQSMLSMAQQQNTQNMQMMGLGMQERRLADSNARDDRRWRESKEMQAQRFAQEDKWKEQQLALQRAHLGMAYGKNAEEMAANKRLNDFLNGMNSPASGGAGSGDTPGLDAAANAAADEVLQPGWSPSSPMGRKGLAMFYPHLAEGAENSPAQSEIQAPALAASHANDPLARAFDLLGVKFPQQRQSQAETSAPIADNSPVQPSTQEMPQAPQMPQMPEPASLTSGSVKITADNFPPQLLGSQRGQAVFNWLKSRDEANLKRHEAEMKAWEKQNPSAAERKEQKELEKLGRAESDAQVGAGNVIDSINKVRTLADKGNFGFLPTTGVWSFLNWAPGTTGHDMEAQLNTIKANMGFDKLQQMRATSPTGGALGAVSDFENKMLQATIANLETSQSKEQFMENLQRAEDTYNRIVHGPSYKKQGLAAGSTLPPPPTGFKVVN